MRVRALVTLVALALAGAACGKYGPPQRTTVAPATTPEPAPPPAETPSEDEKEP